jgi:hypothetical protein
MADPRLRPEWTHVDEIVAEGVRWMRDDVQPAEAVMSHMGRGAHAGGGLMISFSPRGHLGPNRGKEPGAVVVFEIRYPVDTFDLTYEEALQYRPAPFTDDEIAACRDALTDAGLPIIDAWNGAGVLSGSVLVPATAVASSLNRTVANYHKGCPVHDTVFCYSKGCTWYDDGLAGTPLVEPQFIEVGLDVPAAPSPSITNRNLDAVLAAIEKGAPVAEALGIHAALIVPGRRGRVEEDEYVDEEGLAVALPAEVYERLIRLAGLADALGVEQG